jgi:polyisoprenoid-binding protein YceI
MSLGRSLVAALFALGFFALAASPAHADSYAVDPVHSAIIFGAQHMGAGYSWGRFNKFEGTFVMDDDPSKCSVQVTAQATSIDTGNENRDKDLRGPSWFNVEQFPEISFKSTKVNKTGDDMWEVTGDLMFHGVTKPITVQVKRTGMKEMRGKMRVGLMTEFHVNRNDFGMSGMPGGIGDEVRLIVALEGVKQ